MIGPDSTHEEVGAFLLACHDERKAKARAKRERRAKRKAGFARYAKGNDTEAATEGRMDRDARYGSREFQRAALADALKEGPEGA